MLPLRDHLKPSTIPLITYALIAANVLVFFYMFGLSPRQLEAFVEMYAMIPRDIVAGQNLYTLVTSVFLHGGIAHLLGNMLFLHIFGDNLEDAMGHIKYLVFYLLTGVAASALQLVIDPTTAIPNLGASGAIAGLMGGYLLLYPKVRVDVLIPIGFFFTQAALPAYSMLFLWIGFQFISGIGSIGLTNQAGVAYFAHIGGFIAGLLLVNLFVGRNRVERIRNRSN